MSIPERNQLECIIHDAVKSYLDESLNSKNKHSNYNYQPSKTLFLNDKSKTFVENPIERVAAAEDGLQISGSFCGVYAQNSPRFINQNTARRAKTAKLIGNTTKRCERLQIESTATNLDDQKVDSFLPNVQETFNIQETTVQEPIVTTDVQQPNRQQQEIEDDDNHYSNLLTWRTYTPFHDSESKLKSYRAKQQYNILQLDPPQGYKPRVSSPKKLQDSFYRPKSPPKRVPVRPHTARPGIVYPTELNMPGYKTMRGSNDVEQGIKSWLGNADDFDKKVAFNLMKALDSGKHDGLEGQEAEPLPYVLYRTTQTAGRNRPATPLEQYFPTKSPKKTHLKPIITKTKLHNSYNDVKVRPLGTPSLEALTARQKGTDPKILFGGVEDDFSKTQRKLTRKMGPNKDYIHDGACLLNTNPQHRGHFIIHPDWVSERSKPKSFVPRMTARNK